jgi:hypothetical protein
MNQKETIQRYEMHPIPFAICIDDMAVKVHPNTVIRIFGCDLNPHSCSFFFF